jgi:hypothetical protein
MTVEVVDPKEVTSRRFMQVTVRSTAEHCECTAAILHAAFEADNKAELMEAAGALRVASDRLAELLKGMQ